MFSILTPTYNRAYILHVAYESLCRQSNLEFEWIIVDDGSKDETEALVKRWQKECTLFPIIYFKQPNGGKHRAVNCGVGLASYDHILILDSDDYLTEDASEKIHRWMEMTRDLPDFAGFSGSKAKAEGNKKESSYIDATNIERKKYHLLHDQAEVYRTEIMKKYPFPEFEGEKFLPESASWDRIALDGYKLRWFSDVIYICDYLQDGLTRKITYDVRRRNFQGYVYCTQLYLRYCSKLSAFLKTGEFYTIARVRKGGLRETATTLKRSKLYVLMAFIVYKLKMLIRPLIKKLR